MNLEARLCVSTAHTQEEGNSSSLVAGKHLKEFVDIFFKVPHYLTGLWSRVNESIHVIHLEHVMRA